jgi:hypothetical protein
VTSVGNALSGTRAFVQSSRFRRIAYWATTAVIAWELAFGGIWDIVRVPYVFGLVIEDLGIPGVLPRHPRRLEGVWGHHPPSPGTAAAQGVGLRRRVLQL